MRKGAAQIQITDDLRLVRFERGWQIERRKIIQKGKRAGEEDWPVIAYHGDLAHACRSLVRCRFDEVISDAAIDSLCSAARACEEAGERVYNAVRGHPGVSTPYPRSKARQNGTERD